MEDADPGGIERAVSGDRIVTRWKVPLHSKARQRRRAVRRLCSIGLDLLRDEHLAASVDDITDVEEGGGGGQGIFASDDNQFRAGGG